MKKRWLIIGAVILLGLISLYFDAEIVKNVSLIRNVFLNDFFLGITFASSEIIIFFFLTSLFLWTERKRKWILPLWFTLGISAMICFVLKYSVHRLRPFQVGIVSALPVLQKASQLVWDFSFPSFSSMLVFCSVPILSKEFPKLKYVWIVFASLVAFSRLYFGVHYLSDIIFGSLIGYLIGMTIVELEKRNNFWGKSYNRVFRRK